MHRTAAAALGFAVLGGTALAQTKPQQFPSVPSQWFHNGSTFELTKDGRARTLRYSNPRQGMRDVGVKPGTVLFEGEIVKDQGGERYEGTAYIFNKECGPIAYKAGGPVAPDSRRITIGGGLPLGIRKSTGCRSTATRYEDSTFDLVETPTMVPNVTWQGR